MFHARSFRTRIAAVTSRWNGSNLRFFSKRTDFEDEFHLARALSKPKHTADEQRKWEREMRKIERPWNVEAFELFSSAPYEIQALESIHSRSFDANVLLEIRDVRLPASSHHPSFTRLAKHRLHLICYTHADMIDPPTRDRVEAWSDKSWPGSRSIFVDTREHRSDLPYDVLYDSLMGHLESAGGNNVALTVGVANTGKSSLLMCLLRYAKAQGLIPKKLKATSESGMAPKKKKKKKKKSKAEKTVSYLSLADLLRRQPGVMVQGSGNNAKVAIRGGAGPSGTDPLYVLDRVPVGNSYAQVASMVDVNDIANINVLSGADASQYGTRGNSGVIEITTKKE